MKNILSYKPGTKFSGKEIKDWIEFHTSRQTSHTRQALHMQQEYWRLKDTREYLVFPRHVTNDYHDPIYGKMHPYPQVVRAN